MSVCYILDSREKSLQDIFKARSIPFETCQLDLGDILIIYNRQPKMSNAEAKLLGISSEHDTEKESQELTLTIERKSFSDLNSSMSDGRYHEQKHRYMQLPSGTVYYILEKDKKDTLDRKQYLGMYIHTTVRDRIPVILSDSTEDTADLVIKIGETLAEFGIDKFTQSCPQEKTQIKKKKAEGVDVYINQLCCFSGISIGKAKKIVEVYKNINELIEAVKNKTFKVKGIGNTLLENIKGGLLLDK